jgi:opacity protein-like surface antigen
MKTALVLLTCMCATASFALAEDPPDSSLTQGYGAPVPVESGLDYSGLDRSYLNDPNTLTMPAPSFPVASPAWHPDGKRIFFTDRVNLCWVPDTGGKPRVAFENIFIYPYNGKKYVQYLTIDTIVGFSPDGSKLYFTGQAANEKTAAVINLDEKGNWIGGNITDAVTGLQCLTWRPAR